MNKSDIIKKLDEKGIGYDPKSKKDELLAILENSEHTPEIKKSVDVYSKDKYIRTYSEEKHGEGFMKLAERFAQKKRCVLK